MLLFMALPNKAIQYGLTGDSLANDKVLLYKLWFILYQYEPELYGL